MMVRDKNAWEPLVAAPLKEKLERTVLMARYGRISDGQTSGVSTTIFSREQAFRRFFQFGEPQLQRRGASGK